MTWVRIDEGFPEHPKVLAAGGDAAWLFVCGLCYCNRNLTDGFIPEAALVRLTSARKARHLADVLVKVELWERVSPSGTDLGGWQVHDFLHYQPSRSEVEAVEQGRYSVKAEAGRLGGIASGVARRKHKRSSDEAEAKQTGSEHEARPVPSRTDPNEQVSDISTLVDTPPRVGISSDSRINEVAQHYARIALEQAQNVSNPDGYGRKARQTALDHPDLGRYLERWPSAPPDAVAAWLHGDKHSMGYYHDTHDDEVATVTPIRPTGEPA